MIYFVLAEEVNRCKIGFSADPKKRAQVLNGSSPVYLKLLGVIEGTTEHETALHRDFAFLHVKNEWFRYESPLVEFIEAAVADSDAAYKIQETARQKKSLHQSPCEIHEDLYFEWDSQYGDYLILFGKYSGTYLYDLIKKDYAYIDWMLNKADFDEDVAEVVAHTVNRMRMAGII